MKYFYYFTDDETEAQRSDCTQFTQLVKWPNWESKAGSLNPKHASCRLVDGRTCFWLDTRFPSVVGNPRVRRAHDSYVLGESNVIPDFLLGGEGAVPLTPALFKGHVYSTKGNG